MRKIIINTGVFIGALIALGLSTINESHQPVLFLKRNEINRPYLGHGVQWSAYPHADATDAEWGLLMTADKWEELYRRLDRVSPRIVRVMDVASWRYYKGLETDGTPIIDYDTEEIKSLYKLLDYCQSRKLPVLLGEWGAPGFWNEDIGSADIRRADDDRWISMITHFVSHLIIDKGYTCIRYYNLVNEPNSFWASTDGDWEQWKTGYQKLAASFQKNGLSQHIQLAGPDAVTQWDHPTHPKKAVDWVYSTAAEMDGITAVYDIHLYPDQDLVRTGGLYKMLTSMSDSLNSPKKPFILGELGLKYTGELGKESHRRGYIDPYAGADDSNLFVYDYFYGIDMTDAAVQSMLAGVGGAIAWNLDDAMHTVGDKGSQSELKKWGMWNILGNEICGDSTELAPRPWSYAWTLLCNLIPPESKIIIPETKEDDQIRIVGARNHGHFTAVLINQSDKKRDFIMKTNDLHLYSGYYLYEYSEYRPTDHTGFPVVAEKLPNASLSEGIPVSLKPKSVLFISSLSLEKKHSL